MPLSLEQRARSRREHLVDQKAHSLGRHQLGALFGENSGTFSGRIVSSYLRVDLVAVHRRVIESDPDLSRMQSELIRQLGDAALRAPADGAQRRHDFPDVPTDGQGSPPSSRTVAKNDAGKVRRIKTLRDEAFEQGTFRDAFCCRLLLETRLEVGVETI